MTHNEMAFSEVVSSVWCLCLFSAIKPLCMVQFYLLPSPPGNPGDKSNPSVPGVGNCLKPSYPGGEGGRGKSKITSCCSLVLLQYVTSRLTPDRVETTAYFQGESLEFVADWLEKIISQIKICIRRYFYFKLLNECAFNAYSNSWRKQIFISSVSVFIY